MRALYEIDDDIMSCIDEETGEIIDTEKLNALNMEREQKIENVILWRKDLIAEAKAVKEEADNLVKRAKALNNKADQLKDWAKYALNGEKFKTSKCSVSYRTSSGVIIDDLANVPDEYFKMPTEDWISKTAIKTAIEEGKAVPGAHIEEKQSIIIK